MKVVVAGTRTLRDPRIVADAIAASGFTPTLIIHGGCCGVDTLAGDWARGNGIPTEAYPADWDRHGRAAGPRRNQHMVDVADALVAVWDGASRGTRSIIEMAKRKGIPTHIVRVLPC